MSQLSWQRVHPKKKKKKALNALHSHCDLWHLTVNISKTKLVVFSRYQLIFKFGDEELATAVPDDYVYLGVTLNHNGNFKKAISKQVSQAKRAMFSLLSKVTKNRKTKTESSRGYSL